jgi:hypothetical protein
MSWRKIQNVDIKRGTVVRLGNLADDGAYATATIIGTRTESNAWSSWHYVRLARPMAYAHEHFDAKSPMLSCEVFEIEEGRMLAEGSDVEVFQGRDAIRSMVT